MADITLSTGTGHPGILNGVREAIAATFARYRWQRFQLETAPLNERLLADIGIDRGTLSAASTEYAFTPRNEIFVQRHNLG
jgi:uncharacterized protein YjiS (DUF1127 family)